MATTGTRPVNQPHSYVYFVAYHDGTTIANCYIPADRPITTIRDVETLRDWLRRLYPAAVVLSFTHLPNETLTGGGR